MIALLLLLTPCEQGAALFRQGQLEPARQLLEAAVQSQPDAFCTKSLGIVYAALGDTRRAEPHLARACRANPREPDACYFWARALYSLDRFADSLAALDRDPSPPSARAHPPRGPARGARAHNPAGAAIRHARKRADAPPLSLAAVLTRQGRPAESRARLRAAPPAYLRLAPYHYHLGRALAQQEQWAPAAEALRNAVSLQPAYPEAHGLLSRVYYRLGDPTQAARHSALALQGSTISK
ncbi:MAG: tetratricopeptide repeat protein [bacterium]